MKQDCTPLDSNVWVVKLCEIHWPRCTFLAWINPLFQGTDLLAQYWSHYPCFISRQCNSCRGFVASNETRKLCVAGDSVCGCCSTHIMAIAYKYRGQTRSTSVTIEGNRPAVYKGDTPSPEITNSVTVSIIGVNNRDTKHSTFNFILGTQRVWGHYKLHAGRSRFRIPMRSLNIFFNLPNPFSLNMALASTQPLTEMSIRKISGV
jgi:hypothetical protein